MANPSKCHIKNDKQYIIQYFTHYIDEFIKDYQNTNKMVNESLQSLRNYVFDHLTNLSFDIMNHVPFKNYGHIHHNINYFLKLHCFPDLLQLPGFKGIDIIKTLSFQGTLLLTIREAILGINNNTWGNYHIIADHDKGTVKLNITPLCNMIEYILKGIITPLNIEEDIKTKIFFTTYKPSRDLSDINKLTYLKDIKNFVNNGGNMIFITPDTCVNKLRNALKNVFTSEDNMWLYTKDIESDTMEKNYTKVHILLKNTIENKKANNDFYRKDWKCAPICGTSGWNYKSRMSVKN